MGIPRLTGKLAQYIQHLPGSQLKNADLIVDGCNFVHGREEEFSEHGFLKIFRQNLDALEATEPHSLVFYFDAAIPLEKLPTRVNRQKQLIRNTSWQHGMCFNELALEELQARNYKVILTGAEAEDYIFWDLQQSSASGDRKTYVFSSDSDCFTFSLSCAPEVWIVHIAESEQWPNRFVAYNLANVVRSAHVQSYLHAPCEPAALKVVDPKFPYRRGQEFQNTWKVYGQAIMFLPILPASSRPDPHKLSIKWRQAAYAHYLQQDASVQEYRQIGSHTTQCLVQAEQALLVELKPLLKRDIVTLVVDSLASHGIDTLDLAAYLNSLKTIEIPNVKTRENYDQTMHDTLVLVASELLSIKMLAMALEVPLEDHQLLWKLNPDTWEQFRASQA